LSKAVISKGGKLVKIFEVACPRRRLNFATLILHFNS